MSNDETLQRSGRKPRSAAVITFYQQCRLWHGYLSAFAFLALMFFSATGILLNHPSWLPENNDEPQLLNATIPADRLLQARGSVDAGAALGALAAAQMQFPGVYSSGDVDNGEALLRFEGVKGMTTVTVDMRTGKAQARIQKADALTILDDLHRGKNVGAVWAGFIDIAGAVILILSLLGYILFFAMRFRLRTALVLTGVSLAAMMGLFALFVP